VKNGSLAIPGFRPTRAPRPASALRGRRMRGRTGRRSMRKKWRPLGFLPHAGGIFFHVGGTVFHVCGKNPSAWKFFPHTCGKNSQTWKSFPHVCGRNPRARKSFPHVWGSDPRAWEPLPHVWGSDPIVGRSFPESVQSLHGKVCFCAGRSGGSYTDRERTRNTWRCCRRNRSGI